MQMIKKLCSAIFVGLLAMALVMAVAAVPALAGSVPDGTYTEGCLYYTISDESITITGCFGTDATVDVPNIIAGIPVNTIAEGAFVGNDNIQTVNLPDTITTIEEGAFSAGITVNQKVVESGQETAGTREIQGGTTDSTDGSSDGSSGGSDVSSSDGSSGGTSGSSSGSAAVDEADVDLDEEMSKSQAVEGETTSKDAADGTDGAEKGSDGAEEDETAVETAAGGTGVSETVTAAESASPVIFVIIGVVVVAIAVAIIIIVKKRKKEQNTDEIKE